jgi:hypothetical protein
MAASTKPVTSIQPEAWWVQKLFGEWHWWGEEPASPAPSLPSAHLSYWSPGNLCPSPVLPTPSLSAADLSFGSPKKPRPSHFSDCHESTESCRSTTSPSTESLCSSESSQSLRSCHDVQLHCTRPFEVLGDNSLSSELLAQHDNLCAWQHSTIEMASPQVRDVHACFLKACKQQTIPRQHFGSVSRGQQQQIQPLGQLGQALLQWRSWELRVISPDGSELLHETHFSSI